VRQYAEILPEGVQSPNQRLWSVVDEGGTVVGSLWVDVKSERNRAFIFYIIIGPEYRGRGYGRQALALLEDELRPLGISQIGLNVFADNEIARHLYEKMGYHTTNQTMMKSLAPPTPPAE
jgi:ribosomal protein S18 acetylase RimI-like enzyme